MVTVRPEEMVEPDQDGADSREVLIEGRSQYESGDYQPALDNLLIAYALGQKNFQVVKLILNCLHKMGGFEEVELDFINQALVESDLSIEEQAKLNYRLGQVYAQLKKYSQARQAFWRVRRLVPKFPGLEEKLSELERRKGGPSSRYDLLLEKEYVTKEQLDEAKSKARREDKDVDQVLLADYLVPKDMLGESLSAFYEVPFVPFDSESTPPFEVFEKRRLDPEFLKRYGWVPYSQNGQVIEVLMANPFDLGRLDEIRFILGTSRIDPRVALVEDIESFIESFYKQLGAGEELAEFDEEIDLDLDSESSEPVMGDDELSEQDSEVVRLVNALLVEAWKRNASDIHIEPNARSRYCTIRLRVDGTCHEFKKIRLGLARPLISRVKIMSHLDIAERRLPQDGKVRIKLPELNKVVEFRVATMPTVDNQEDVVLRVLSSGKPLDLEDLGLTEHNLEIFDKVIHMPYGMVLVVGPTGSGKTTTLHSALSLINTSERKIWTAEDPVEITQAGLRQVQVNPKIGLTFASCLRSFLRADPDVIMIGEMRDEQTAHIGVEASLTGHLVFSTLHTNSAPETITRLLDMNVDPFNFADSLLCVSAQRLVKTLCQKCKEPYHPSREEMEELRLEFGQGWGRYVEGKLDKNVTLYRAKGCRVCVGGYKGRIGLHEIMANSDKIKKLIKRRRHTEEIREEAMRVGMITLKQDGILKILRGDTDIKQVRSAAMG
ncbi:MAG: ATPase, T2SS/T4P/T4SS family [Desulfohalobiaceae bacterium]